MYSSPRTNRGTSIIAALVFAAVLGAIALSLNAFQLNSVTNSSLPAAAATVTQSDETCQDGQDFNYTVSAQTSSVSPTYSEFDAYFPVTQSQNAVSAPKIVQVCPTDAQALEQAKQQPGVYLYQGQYVGLPASLSLSPNVSSRAGTSCVNGKPETANLSSGYKCTYIKQANNTYTLQNWKCRVTFTNPTPGAPQADACWIKDVPVQGSVTASTPDASQTPSSGATPNSSSAGNSTITANQTLPPACQADANSAACQAALATAGTQSGYQGPCPNGQTINASTGACEAFQGPCPNGQVMDATTGACQTQAGFQGPCPNGQVMNSAGQCGATQQQTQTGTCTANGQTGTYMNGQCVAQEGGTQTVTTQTPSSVTTQPPKTNGSTGSSLGALTSLLGGLTRGLSSPCAQTGIQNPYTGGNGTSLVPVQVYNPTTGTYSTTYVQQNSTANAYGTSQPCAQQQQTPYGVGSNGAACAAPPAAPTCASGSTAQPVSASGNGCVTGYQCVPTNSTIAQTPTPQLSCSPQIADVGQPVAISYSCTNATASTGSGFSTDNQMSGSATVTVQAPPSGTNSASYGLTCTNNGQNASAQCHIQINQPAIDLVANPQSVPSGQTATIGWVTAGMKSCVISSPQDTSFTQQNASNTNVNGAAQSDALSSSTEFDLTCTTLGGQTKTASTVVTIGATSTAASVNVSSTIDGQSVNHGGTATITWSVSNPPSNSAVALWLIDLRSEQATALIASNQSMSGTYQWQLPAAGSSCDQNSLAPCAADIVAGNSYGIEASVYTPPNAYFGSSVPSGSVGPNYLDYGYTANPFTVGQ